MGKWPQELLLVRHGESAGNVARELAHVQGLTTIEIEGRDCDVPLSELGTRQARALGEWLSEHERSADAVLCSPYVRAVQTADLAIESARWHKAHRVIDERLREKEFGILDRLTFSGIQQQYPDQAEMRRQLGKFYYRPPGGESWTDVILRLRSIIDTLVRDYREKRVMIVSHQVVVLCFRYLLERLTEKQILDIDRAADVANCSITKYVFDKTAGENGKLKLDKYNFVAPLEERGARVTAEPDVPVAPK